MRGDGTRWIIEAPTDALVRAGFRAGINDNAVRRLDAQESALTYPSVFCDDRGRWLKVMSYLAVRNLPFQVVLSRVEVIDGELEPEEVSRVQLYPKIDGPMLKLMREIDQSEAGRLEHLGGRIEDALEIMRRDAGTAPPTGP